MEDIYSMEGFAEKKSMSILSVRHNITVLHTKIHPSFRPPHPVFCKKKSTQIFNKIFQTKYSFYNLKILHNVTKKITIFR